MVFGRVRRLFGVLARRNNVASITTSKRITADMVRFVSDMSKFADMDEVEIEEQLYAWEADIGGAIDRVGTLTSQSYKGMKIDVETSLDPQESRCLELGNKIYEDMKTEDLVESLSELLMMHGNVFMLDLEDSVRILPNKWVTMVDDKDRIGSGQEGGAKHTIFEPNFLVLFENLTDAKNEVYDKDKFIHIKYKNTPIFEKDLMNRNTYGLYSISPIHRTILPVWWKRQTMIVDIMHRWRNVPREHHKLSSEMFSLDKYSGTKDEKLAAATSAAEAALESYKAKIKSQEPDQGYISLDNMTVEVVAPTGSGYMQTNELMTQLDKRTWIALNIPESIVSGANSGSFASELVISNYVTAKVIQISKKIKPTVLDIIKSRVLDIDDTLPVNKLDIKIELVLSTSQIEIFRQAAIMTKMGLFTDTEIRKLLGYEELTDEQWESIKKRIKPSIREGSLEDDIRDIDRSGDSPTNPETPHSRDNDHTTEPIDRN